MQPPPVASSLAIRHWGGGWLYCCLAVKAVSSTLRRRERKVALPRSSPRLRQRPKFWIIVLWPLSMPSILDGRQVKPPLKKGELIHVLLISSEMRSLCRTSTDGNDPVVTTNCLVMAWMGRKEKFKDVVMLLVLKNSKFACFPM